MKWLFVKWGCRPCWSFSTVKDVSHFITMILNNGKYNDQQILSPTTIDLMFTPQVHEKVE